MKTLYILLISLFLLNGALSLNAFAQSKYPSSNSLENVRRELRNSGRKTSDIHSEINMVQTIKPQKPQQSTVIQKYDSIYYWNWHTVGSIWGLDYKEINMVYDPNNNLISKLRQFRNATAWVNTLLTTNTYDANNNLTSEVYQQWNNNAWENTDSITYTYDANDNRTSKLWEQWNGSGWNNYDLRIDTYNVANYLISEVQYWYDTAWENDGQDIYTYDGNNNLTSELEQGWNGSTWDNSWQRIYTYDAYNNRTSELWQNWINSAWENELQANYSYDVNNNKISVLEQHWNGSGWVNYSQHAYTYDASNYLISESGQDWIGNAWEDAYQTTYTYDANYNLINVLKLRHISGSIWRNNYQYISTYDDNNFTLSNSHKFWNLSGTVLQGDSTDYYFHTIVGINNLVGREGSITVYPNPTSTSITLLTPIKGSLSILNINGKEILHEGITEPKTQLDINNLPSGVYFVKVTGEKTVQVGKFIKQ